MSPRRGFATTFVEVETRFTARSLNADRLLRSWVDDPRRAQVVPVLADHQSNVIYQLSPADVVAVCNTTEHALGQVNKAQVASIHKVRDWHPDFAFTHAFHVATEQMGRLPTYGEFRTFCNETELGAKTLGDPARALVASFDQDQRHLAAAAIRWRVGNAYYSFLREVYVLAVLRDAGIMAKMHPIADALFRVDLWIRDLNLSLYVGNKAFRSGSSGRKTTCEELLADASPSFEYRHIELATQHRYGVVHLPDPDEAIASIR